MSHSAARRLLLKAATFASAFSVPGIAPAFTAAGGMPASALPASFEFTYLDIAELGRCYCDLRPEEADQGRLLALIQAVSGTASLDTVISHEFHAGKIELINGWVLSRTEARFYALYFLTGKGRGA